jgi:SNF2 family DNA or RNA helicase
MNYLAALEKQKSENKADFEPFVWENVLESTMSLIENHQRNAVNLVVNEHAGRSMLALGMGSGKTMVAALVCNHFHRSHSLIIVPSNKVEDWVRDFKRWTGKPAFVLPSKKQDPLPGVCICSTTNASMWLDQKPGVATFAFDSVIVDEAQSLKGNSSQSRRIVPLVQKAHSCLLLSGTPMMNKPSELFNLLSAIHPRVFKCYERQKWISTFSDGYVDPKFANARCGFRETGIKPEMKGVLNALLKMVMSREGSSRQLPPLTRKPLAKDPLNEKMKAKLTELRDEGYALSAAQKRAKTDAEFDAATFKMNVASNARWIASGEMKAEVFAVWLRHLVAVEHVDEGIAVFCMHVETACKVRDVVKDVYPEVTLVTGETSGKVRNEVIKKVATGVVRVGVFTAGSCGTGIDLVPSVSVIVLFELPQVPALCSQTECRAHRIGQTRPVTSYWCMLNGSQDERTFASLQNKQMNISAALDGEDTRGFTFHN